MKIVQDELSLRTKGNADTIDITGKVQSAVTKSGLARGLATLFVVGSTATLSTIEYEPNLVDDMKDALDRLIPADIEYAHTRTWGDHNGHAHVRATLMGPSLQIPFIDKRLTLGTWQQVILIDFDTHPRQRGVVVQLMGE